MVFAMAKGSVLFLARYAIMYVVQVNKTVPTIKQEGYNRNPLGIPISLPLQVFLAKAFNLGNIREILICPNKKDIIK